MMALFMGPLDFYKLVYFSVIMSTLYSLVETYKWSFQAKLEPRDFEYIVTWEAGNNSGMPTCFSVMYSSRSVNCFMETESDSSEKDKGQDTPPNKFSSQQNEDPDHQVLQPGEQSVCPPVPEKSVWSQKNEYRSVVGCTNITRSFCNLTKVLIDPCKTYTIIVEQVTRNEVHQSKIPPFVPYLDTCLGQPQFKISLCPNCVNVTVKLSSPLLLNLYKNIKYTIRASTAGLPDKRQSNATNQESFYAVVRNLHPNRNYCLTVDVSTNTNNKQCTPSSPKCIITRFEYESDHILTATLVGISVPLLVVLVLLVFYKVGLICLKTDWPDVLHIIPKLAYSVFDSVPEEVHPVKVKEESKKKVWNYDNDDEDSESDVEDDGFYTVHKISKTCSTIDIVEHLSLDCSSPTDDTVESGTDDSASFQNEINKGKSATTSQVLNHSSKRNSTNEPELEHNSCLNVNLNSVKLGISNDTWDVPATLDPDQEDTADLKDSCITDESESVHLTDIPNMQSPIAHRFSCPWQNTSGSAESESSDSETNNIGDYMRR